MNENKNNTENYFFYFFLIAGILIVATIVFGFVVNCIFSDWKDSGPFGDTFGALNTLFSGLALSGVIVTILIQKKELKNQRIELKLQREEFLTNRITNLIYNQLERFEKCLNKLQIKDGEETYIGNDAFSFLNENRIIISESGKTEEVYNAEMKAAFIKLLVIYKPNKLQIEKFAHTAYNSIEAVKHLIYKTELEIEELNDIKALFFDNIGFINMGVIEQICEIAEEERTYLITNDYIENDLDVGILMKASVFLKSIKDFYHVRFTKENFPTLKAKWIESRGED